jgi:murein DD-endopeptidase MepM/ murein hydrolase activator NlpD
LNTKIKLWLLLLLTGFATASIERIETSIEAGDTLNQVLRRHHVNPNDIHQVNMRQFQELNTISPYDRVSLVINTQSNALLSCQITKSKHILVLHKMINGYKIQQQKHQPNQNILTIHTHSNYPLDSNMIRYKRMVNSIDHEFNGTAEVITQDNRAITLKLYHPNHVALVTIHDTEDQHGFSLSESKKTLPFFSRTPTDYKRISSHFDPNRVHPILNKVIPHLGVDLAAPINTPIWAAAEGTVTHKSTDSSFGNYLIITHPFGATTHYAHMNKFHHNIKVGDQVNAFQTIGYIGSTGRSTGPHLHFELHIDQAPVDPLTAVLPTLNLNKNKP